MSLFALGGPSIISALGQDVLTQHNDNQRTGANLNETELTPENVKTITPRDSKKGFGLLFSRKVQGYIYAQPLYVTHVDVAMDSSTPKNLNLVIVATGENYVYAFDADNKEKNAKWVWRTTQLERAGIPDAFGINPKNPQKSICPLTTWPVGITSTPVIDKVNNRLYVVAREDDPDSTDIETDKARHWLHVLDLRTGADLKHVEIKYDGDDPQGPPLAFQPAKHFNRTGLLLVNGRLYFGFAAMCDRYNSHGWVFSFDALTLERKAVFCTTPKAVDEYVSGGVWQSGNGFSTDQAGQNIYLMTGNGEFNVLKRSFGSSFLQLRADDLKVNAYFAPNNQETLSKGDVDLGSGGPLLLPGDRLFGGGKQGRYYVLAPATDSSQEPVAMKQTQNEAVPNGENMDGFQAFINTHHTGSDDITTPCALPLVEVEDDRHQVACARCAALKKNQVIVRDCYGKSQYYGPNIHGGPVFWKDAGLIYGTAEKDYIKAFRYYPNREEMHCPNGPCVDYSSMFKSTERAPDGMPGGFLSLSANKERNGIIWASFPQKDNTFFTQPGRLVAFDARTLEKLWSDDDPTVGFAKFCPPTVGGGRVFRAAFVKGVYAPAGLDKGRLMVYGLCSPEHPCIAPHKEWAIIRLFRKLFSRDLTILVCPSASSCQAPHKVK
jgi:outer membrane protein assembly factor BamB